MMDVASFVTRLGLMAAVKERQAAEFLHCLQAVRVVVNNLKVVAMWGPEQPLGPVPYVKMNFFRPSELESLCRKNQTFICNF